MPFKNYMEDMVIKELNGVLNQVKNICKCERCREDIVALALNSLKPKYVVTDLGDMYTRLEQLEVQLKADVTIVVLNSAKIVKKKPRH